MIGPVNLKLVLGIAIALLLIWIGLTGKLGSLLASMITPDALVEQGNF